MEKYIPDLDDDDIVQVHEVTRRFRIFLKILILFIAVALILIIIAINKISNVREKQNEMHTITLGSIVEQCDLKITVNCSHKPIDIVIYAPDGHKYSSASAEYSLNNNVITFLIPTKSIGEWTAVYNEKNNASIDINFEPQKPENLLLRITNYEIIDNTLYVTFSGAFIDDATSYKYSVHLSSDMGHLSMEIASDMAPANKPITVSKQLRDNMPAQNDYQLSIGSYNQENISDETLRDSVKIAIGNLSSITK